MNTPIHIQRFNDKIKLLNQGNSREIVLTASEARNLHTEVFSLLTEITQLQEKVIELTEKPSDFIEVQMDGGGFS
jgi:hypothetical protein